MSDLLARKFYIFMLVTGETIISEIREDDRQPDSKLIYPCLINVVPQPNGQIGYAFRLYAFFSKEQEIDFPKLEHVLFKYTPDTRFIELYNEFLVQIKASRAGLVTPNQIAGLGPKIGGGTIGGLGRKH